jgi:esterase
MEIIDGNMWVRANGLRFHFRDLGPRSAPPILFLHGIMGHAYEWDALFAQAARNHRILALDQRGHGLSDWNPPYTPEAMAADILAVIDSLGLVRPHLAGHSMGGINALLAAARRPDRVGRLILIDIGPDSVTTEWAHHQLPAMLTEFAGAAYADMERAVSAWMAGNPLAQETYMRHYVRHALREGPAGKWVWRFDAAGLTEFSPNTRAEDLWMAPDEVRNPALVIRGRESSLLSPETAAAMTRRLRRGSLVEIAGGGHDLGVEQPEAVAAALVAFLADRSV